MIRSGQLILFLGRKAHALSESQAWRVGAGLKVFYYNNLFTDYYAVRNRATLRAFSCACCVCLPHVVPEKPQGAHAQR